MAGNIKGITVEIGGDTTGLDKALKTLNASAGATQKELKEVTRLLKLDPTNTTLLAQKQELLGKAISANKEKLTALQNAKAKADQDMANGTEVNQEQYRKLCREIEAAQIVENNLQKQQDSVTDAIKKTNAEISKFGEGAKAVSDGSAKIADGAKKISDGAKEIAKETKVLSAAAAGLLTISGKYAAAFEDSFAKVSTLLDESSVDYEAYKNDIIKASDETGVAVTDYSEAVYSAISANVDQAKAVDFTTAAVKLAKGGFTDTTKAVDVMTTAINGYSMSADEATKISDLLITTQNLGKTTVDELASSMGKVIPIASASNYSMEELSATYAMLTRNGIATAEAGTYTKSMLNELSKAGSATDETLRELTGKGFAELKADGVSTTDILKMLSAEAEDNGKTLKDMFSSVEAGSAAMVLAKGDGAEYNEILQQMEESAGATETAFNKVSGTTSEQIKKALNDLKNLSIELGDVLLPIVNDLVSAFRGFVEKLKGMNETQLKTLATILLIVAAIAPVAKIVQGISHVVGLAATAISTFSGAIAIFTGAATTGTAASTALAGALTFLAANPIVLIIGVIVAAIKDDHRAMRDKLYSFFQPRETGTLFVTDGDVTRKIDYKTEFVKVEPTGQQRKATISLICPDPLFKATTDDRVDMATWEGLIEWPDDVQEIPSVPFEMTTKTSRLVATIENASNVSRGLTVQFTATGTVTNPSLFEVKTQKGFKIILEMHAGDVLTVTTGLKNKRVRLKTNGAEKSANNLWVYGSTWLQAEPGDNVFRYDAETGIENLDVSVSSTPAFWGV